MPNSIRKLIVFLITFSFIVQSAGIGRFHSSVQNKRNTLRPTATANFHKRGDFETPVAPAPDGQAIEKIAASGQARRKTQVLLLKTAPIILSIMAIFGGREMLRYGNGGTKDINLTSPAIHELVPTSGVSTSTPAIGTPIPMSDVTGQAITPRPGASWMTRTISIPKLLDEPPPNPNLAEILRLMRDPDKETRCKAVKYLDSNLDRLVGNDVELVKKWVIPAVLWAMVEGDDDITSSASWILPDFIYKVPVDEPIIAESVVPVALMVYDKGGRWMRCSGSATLERYIDKGGVNDFIVRAVVPTAIRHLESKDKEEIMEATDILDKFFLKLDRDKVGIDEKMIMPLIALRDHQDEYVRYCAIVCLKWAMRKMPIDDLLVKEQIVPMAVELLDDPYDSTRRWSAELLQDFAERAASDDPLLAGSIIPEVIRTLKDPHHHNLWCKVLVLNEFIENLKNDSPLLTKELILALVRTFECGDEYVLDKANRCLHTAIGKLGGEDPRLKEALLPALRAIVDKEEKLGEEYRSKLLPAAADLYGRVLVECPSMLTSEDMKLLFKYYDSPGVRESAGVLIGSSELAFREVFEKEGRAGLNNEDPQVFLETLNYFFHRRDLNIANLGVLTDMDLRRMLGFVNNRLVGNLLDKVPEDRSSVFVQMAEEVSQKMSNGKKITAEDFNALRYIISTHHLDITAKAKYISQMFDFVMGIEDVGQRRLYLYSLCSAVRRFDENEVSFLTERIPDFIEKVEETTKTIIHKRPPYEEIFDPRRNPNQEFNIMLYVPSAPDIKEPKTMLSLFRDEGYSEMQEGETFIFQKEVNGKKVKAYVDTFGTAKGYQGEIFNHMNDPDIHMIAYCGHSGFGHSLGHAIEAAYKSGQLQCRPKIIGVFSCYSIQYYYGPILVRFPHSHFIGATTSSDSLVDLLTLKIVIDGVTRGLSWEEIALSYNQIIEKRWIRYGNVTYSWPHAPRLDRFDLDKNGLLDSDLRPSGGSMSFIPTSQLIILEDNDNFKFVAPVNLNISNIRSEKPEDVISLAKGIFKDDTFLKDFAERIVSRGFEIDYSDGLNAVTVAEHIDEDGNVIYEISINAGYKDCSESALAMMTIYELNSYFSEADKWRLTPLARLIRLKGLQHVARFAKDYYKEDLFDDFLKHYGIEGVRLEDILKTIDSDEEEMSRAVNDVLKKLGAGDKTKGQGPAEEIRRQLLKESAPSKLPAASKPSSAGGMHQKLPGADISVLQAISSAA